MGPSQSGHPAQPASSPRVLSIQSHVVHGYVGNKCAVFPLQLLGFEVDPIYSVQFSNHTGYPSFNGARFDGEHLKSLIVGLEENGLMQGYTHLLSGYMGSVTVLEAIAEVMQKMKAANNGHVTYVCDPVMGDEGKLYLAPEMVQAYRDRIMPLASVLVPNQFEAELLAGCSSPITSLQGGLDACEALHAQGPHTVIITSMNLPEDTHHVTLLASTTQEQSAGPHFQRLALRIPKIDAYFTGTGDLMAALLLGWLHHHPQNLKLAIEKASRGLQLVLMDTAAACGASVLKAPRTSEICAARELRLVQNQAKLAEPELHVSSLNEGAQKLECIALGGQKQPMAKIPSMPSVGQADS